MLLIAFVGSRHSGRVRAVDRSLYGVPRVISPAYAIQRGASYHAVGRRPYHLRCRMYVRPDERRLKFRAFAKHRLIVRRLQPSTSACFRLLGNDAFFVRPNFSASSSSVTKNWRFYDYSLLLLRLSSDAEVDYEQVETWTGPVRVIPATR